MKRKPIALLLILSMLLALSLTGCGKDTALTVYAEGNFIRQDLIDAFTEETGIEVNYIIGTRSPAETKAKTDDANSTKTDSSADEEVVLPEESSVDVLSEVRAWKEKDTQARAESSESDGAVCDYDVILTDQDILSQLKEEDCLMELDTKKVSNYDNIAKKYRKLNGDGALYGIPALWGIAGIVWDTKLVDTQVSSWDILWDETYKGKIVMPATARECAAVALKRQGKDVNTTDKKELEDAYKLLDEQKDLAAGYTSRVAYTMMTNQSAALAVADSGAAIDMMSNNANLAFALPDEGSWRVCYSYCVPAGTEWPEEAQKFINYMCSANNLAKNAVYSKYSTTSGEALKKMNQSWHDNPLAYPDETIRKQSPFLTGLPAETETLHGSLFAQLTGADTAADNTNNPQS